MAIDATFWVAVSFIIFFGGLIYLKIPQKINELLSKLITDIKNEINESEKLRTEAKTLLDNAQNKLDTAQNHSKEIKKTEIEIKDLKNKAPEKINKIAIEISTDLIQQLIGSEVNNSSISAIVSDFSKKDKDKYYGN